jgi:hypothetical protein
MALKFLKGSIRGDIDCIVELGTVQMFLHVVKLIDNMGKYLGMFALRD